MQSNLYIGLMSGTSLDGIDAACLDLSQQRPSILGTLHMPLEPDLKKNIIKLCQGHDDSIDCLGSTDYLLGKSFANTTLNLLDQLQLKPEEIRAIGSHGQTIRHRPNSQTPFTLQIGDPNLICQTTGITTVADFRRADMARQGQGAPLAPAFHQHLAQQQTEPLWILNLGGMANITYLPGTNRPDELWGCDTGPGNILLDAHAKIAWGIDYDPQGERAQQGKVVTAWLERLLQHPFFKQKPPKSTGRESFNCDFLSQQLNRLEPGTKTQDIQATLSQLTAMSISECIKQSGKKANRIYLCGGGSHNQTLIQQIEKTSGLKVQSIGKLGIEPDWIEAAAFAWMAQQTLEQKPIQIKSVSGARSNTILGGVYYKNL